MSWKYEVTIYIITHFFVKKSN